MKTESVDPCAIAIPHRLRAVDPSKVKQIAESMAAIGLQQPVTVWSPKDGDVELIAGAHRVEAAVSLGWDYMDCIFRDEWSEIDRQLWEIDENLIRAELTPAQQADHMARRKALWEQRAAAESGTSCPTLTGRGNVGFASDTAEKTGTDKRTVNRAVSRGESIAPDVMEMITGTALDKGVYLDLIKDLSHDEQRAKVWADLAEIAKPKPPPKKRVAVVTDADDDQFEALKRAWNKASSEARRRFEIWLADNG